MKWVATTSPRCLTLINIVHNTSTLNSFFFYVNRAKKIHDTSPLMSTCIDRRGHHEIMYEHMCPLLYLIVHESVEPLPIIFNLSGDVFILQDHSGHSSLTPFWKIKHLPLKQTQWTSPSSKQIDLIQSTECVFSHGLEMCVCTRGRV